jgi:hypothetical protein
MNAFEVSLPSAAKQTYIEGRVRGSRIRTVTAFISFGMHLLTCMFFIGLAGSTFVVLVSWLRIFKD